MANPYVQIRRTFQFIDCAVRQDSIASKCRDLPDQVRGHNTDSALRDFVLCQMLVAIISQLEDDITELRGIPNLQGNSLAGQLRALRDHFQISHQNFDGVDRLRSARNDFVHNGIIRVNPGCTKVQIPGIVVQFLQQCQHPNYA